MVRVNVRRSRQAIFAAVIMFGLLARSVSADFSTRQDFAVGNDPSSVAVAGLNGDGKPDVVTADTSSLVVSVQLNATTPGDTTFSFTLSQFGAGGAPVSVALADL